MGEDIRIVSEYEDAIDLLYAIGMQKDFIPFKYRGYVSILGLHVQLRRAGGIERLQAGGKYRPCFDALTDKPSDLIA